MAKVTVININDNTDLIKKASVEAISRALEMCGSQAENYAVLLCPVDTGRLKNSITHTIGGAAMNKIYYDDSGNYGGSYFGTMGHEEDYTVYIGTNVEYAEAVELGTSRQRAQPYLKPALIGHVREYENILKSELSNG